MRLITASFLGLVAAACGGGDDSSTSSGSGDDVAVSGQILLEDYSDELKPDTLLVMKTLGGSLDDTDTGTEQLALDDSGSFSANLAKTDQTLAALQATVNDDGTVDREAAAEAIGESVEELEDISDEDLIEYLDELIEQSEKQGGPLYLLIGAATGGETSLALSLEDKAEIANTFRFVGLPGDAGNLIGLPAAQSKSGSLALGEVAKDDGDEASSDLEASSDVFDLTDTALNQLNGVDDILKGVKNSYINDVWAAQPFFLWENRSTDKEVINNQYSTPSEAELSGYGFYVFGDGVDFDFTDICAEDEADRKALELFPPAELIVGNADDGDEVFTVDEDTPFDNGGSIMTGSQDGNDTCSASSFYARDDGSSTVTVNYGTGGSIQLDGSIPAGLWYLKYESDTVGIFDLATSGPLDGDGNPNVFIPAVKATTDDDGFITKVSVLFYYYDKSSEEYVEITDTTAIDKLVSTIQVEVTRDDTTGSESDDTEERLDLDVTEDGVYESETFTGRYKISGENGDSDPVARDVAVYYVIGDNSYRFEFRDQ